MVAVTGATGLLGTHILEQLISEQVPVIGLHRSSSAALAPGVVTRQGDILNEVSLRQALEGATTVIHAAALVSFNPRQRKNIYETNVIGTRNVVNTCLNLGIPNLIHVSSVAALGRKHGEITNETTRWTETSPTGYAESKYLSELEVYRGAEEGLTVSMVNPSVILSSSKFHQSSAALFDYVWKQRRFVTNGNLNYVDALDVVHAIVELYRRPRAGEKFILSAGSVSFQDFFTEVAKYFSKRPPNVKISERVAGWAGAVEEFRAWLFQQEPLVTRQTAYLASQTYGYDNSKARLVLGSQFHSLAETLERCCTTYLRNVKVNK